MSLFCLARNWDQNGFPFWEREWDPKVGTISKGTGLCVPLGLALVSVPFHVPVLGTWSLSIISIMICINLGYSGRCADRAQARSNRSRAAAPAGATREHSLLSCAACGRYDGAVTPRNNQRGDLQTSVIKYAAL